MSAPFVSLALIGLFAAVVLVLLAGRLAPRWSATVALGAALAALAGVAAAALHPVPDEEWPWIDAWGIRLAFGLDRLGVCYALLTTTVAVLVLVYAPGYMRHHLHEQGLPRRRLTPFFALFTLFVAAMLGLITSFGLLQLFFFWDITTICSFLLIAYDRERQDARRAALMALIVTGTTSILFLVAALLLEQRYGTTDVRALSRLVRGDGVTAAAVGMIIVAALGKSAQWPFHFWLPRAMAAPTPVSAYLHAAAMVAAGVFVLQRTQPLLEAQPFAMPVLIAIGLGSMVAGGVLALSEKSLKGLLAYSTMAQYGHVVFLIGVGGAKGAASAAFFVVAHGLCKSALFLTAGAVTTATGAHALSEVGGLRRRAPVLAVAAGVVAAGLAGAPLTVGFFKDEVLFAAAHERGLPLLLAALMGPVFTVAYTWRFWSGIFLGRVRGHAGRVPRSELLPIGIAAALVVTLGLWPRPLVQLGEAAAAPLGSAHLAARYHLDARPTNLAALAAFGVGALLVWGARHAERELSAIAGSFGPERVYLELQRWLRCLGAVTCRMVPPTLRGRTAVVLLVTALLVCGGQLALGWPAPELRWSWSDAAPSAALLGACVAALTVVYHPRQQTAAIALSIATIVLAAFFVLAGARDVALVLVVVNVISTLLVIALLYRLPNAALEEQERLTSSGRRRAVNAAVSLGAGVLAFFVVYGTLSRPRPDTWLGQALFEAAPRAHAKNAVTATLVDFRGLDTLGEITVVVISVLALDTLMHEMRDDE